MMTHADIRRLGAAVGYDEAVSRPALKKALTVLVAVALLTGTLSFVTAGSYGRDEAAPADAPTTMRLSGAVRTPQSNFGAAYRLNAHIIVVPAITDRAAPDRRVTPSASINDDDINVAPPPRRVVYPAPPAHPRWPLHSAMQKPARAVPGVPQPQAEGPTPVRPTTRFVAPGRAEAN